MESVNSPEYAMDLRRTAELASEVLLRIPVSAPALAPQSHRWSAPQILGHLIDSASINHQRFVRAQFQDHLVFSTYDQDRWVAAQHHTASSWKTLVQLWAMYNHHIAHIMEFVPPEVRERVSHRHNFHQIAWKTIQENVPTTLDYLMRDYVAHLKHHLDQMNQLPGITLAY